MKVVGLVLFLGAGVGHAAIIIRHMNWWYGLPLPRKLVHGAHVVLVLLCLAGLALLHRVFGWDFSRVLDHADQTGWHALLASYVCVCWLVGFGVLPVLTCRRLWRRPALLISNHSRVVDIADRLGSPPLGRGKHRRLARLPGNQVFQVELAERTLRLRRLPAAWDGLTILHLSDLHFCGTPDRTFFQAVMDLCSAEEPDLVAVTGDFVDTWQHHRWIVPVLGRLRWKTAAFAILGNHDSWFDPLLIRRRLRRLGMHVLANAWTQIEVRGEPLVVIGNESPWFTPAPDLSTCPAGGFRLCLSHTPDNIRWARQHDIDLMLSGHVHGGQIRLPGIGSVFVPSRYGRKYDCGTFDENPTVLHVSRGLGGEHPVRYFCRPEATKLILRLASGDPKGP
jgi:predicted MPP superfamily phosphohydrolase